MAAPIPWASTSVIRQRLRRCSIPALPSPAGTAAAPGFSCWKQCASRWFLCSWPPHGPCATPSYLLTLCYKMPRLCLFEAGTRTTYTLKHHHVYVPHQRPRPGWKARWGDHVHRTPNLTLYLNEAGPDPPPAGMPFTKTGGQLRLQVPQLPCHRQGPAAAVEARFRRKDDRVWDAGPGMFGRDRDSICFHVPVTYWFLLGGCLRPRFSPQVTCETVTDEDDSVTCALGGNGSFEVQLRNKPPHWSSYWSDWSSSIFVPAGEEEERKRSGTPTAPENADSPAGLVSSCRILASPALSYLLGKLGRDGQRVLRLGWQVRQHPPRGPSWVSPRHFILRATLSPSPSEASEEQGNVTYMLCARMLACRCGELAEEDASVLGREVTAHNLISAAEYEILLTAANAAGTGPARQLRAAEQRADLSFKDISVAGGTVTAQWEALSPGFAYCFEQQPPKRSVCSQRDFPAKSIHVERGALETPACYRFAVHGWAPARGWSTFALQHHYAGNASLAVPIHINASTRNAAVVLQWSPSPRAACPGALAKYLICHAAEGDNVTYGEADAAASHYTLQNLRPGTAYRVGVWEVTAQSGGTCSAWQHFQTKALGPQGTAWKSNLKYLGIALSLPTVAAVYQLSKKRAHRLLFPPLPKPVGTKAIQFSAEEMSQGQPWPGFVEPSESFSPAELLLPEPNPGKETTDASTRPCTPQPGPAAEEPAVMCLPGCDKELPFAYQRQEVLSPAGSPLPGSTGRSGHPAGEEEEEEAEEAEEEEAEEGRQGLHQLLVPIALLISDKPVIIRDEEGWDPSPEKSVP
ncbi:LOW QUALITY PROTEIN: interleukin-12 receptor subunit beta-1 [Ciconia maguari]